MDDGKIIEKLKRRDESALTEIEKKYSKLLFRLAFGVLCSNEDSEEVINDTLLAVWSRASDSSPENLSAYLCKITRNLAIKKLRRETAQKRNSNYNLSLEELGDIFPSSDSSEELLMNNETKRVISDFIKNLDDRTRRIFLRRYWFFDSTKEIADNFSLSENNVRTILFRTRKELKEYLLSEGINI